MDFCADLWYVNYVRRLPEEGRLFARIILQLKSVYDCGILTYQRK